MAGTKRAARQKAIRAAVKATGGGVAVAEKPSGKGVPEAFSGEEPKDGGLLDAFPGDNEQAPAESQDGRSSVYDFTLEDNTLQDTQEGDTTSVGEVQDDEAEEGETNETIDSAEDEDAGDAEGEADSESNEDGLVLTDELKERVKEWGFSDSEVERFETSDELDAFLNRMDVAAGTRAAKPAVVPQQKVETKPAEPLEDPSEFKFDMEMDPEETDPTVIKLYGEMKKMNVHLAKQNTDLRQHLVAMNERAVRQAADAVAQEWDEGIKQLDGEFRELLGAGTPSTSLDVNSQEALRQNELLEVVKGMAAHRQSKGLPVMGMLHEMQRRAVKIVFEKQTKAKAQEAKNEKMAHRHSQKTRRPAGQRKGGPARNARESAVDKIKDHAVFKGMPVDEPDDAMMPMGL